MLAKLKIFSLCGSMVVILSACGGGGGGGSSSSATSAGFTSWGAVQPNSTVVASGNSTQFTYQASAATGVVSLLTNNGISNGGASVSLSYGSGSLNLTGISIQSAQGATASVGNGNGSVSVIGVGPVSQVVYGINAARSTEILGINAPSLGWNYQTYGVWVTGEGTGGGTAGAVSGGSPTPVTGMPATGTALFTGNAIGIVGAQGIPAYAMAASMAANTNFASRSIAFSTSGSTAASFNGGGAFSAPGLNMSGTLAYGAGSNQFSGAVSAANGMTGSVAGQFYGPNANEIGGTFNLSSSSGMMGGGFGGKR